jgi:hypothetical protein
VRTARETERSVAATTSPADEVAAAAAAFDHLNPETAANVHNVLGSFRRSCAVVRSDAHGGYWLVTGYDPIREVARRGEVFGSAVTGLGAAVVVPNVDGVIVVRTGPRRAHRVAAAPPTLLLTLVCGTP